MATIVSCKTTARPCTNTLRTRELQREGDRYVCAGYGMHLRGGALLQIIALFDGHARSLRIDGPLFRLHIDGVPTQPSRGGAVRFEEEPYTSAVAARLGSDGALDFGETNSLLLEFLEPPPPSISLHYEP